MDQNDRNRQDNIGNERQDNIGNERQGNVGNERNLEDQPNRQGSNTEADLQREGNERNRNQPDTTRRGGDRENVTR